MPNYHNYSKSHQFYWLDLAVILAYGALEMIPTIRFDLLFCCARITTMQNRYLWEVTVHNLAPAWFECRCGGVQYPPQNWRIVFPRLFVSQWRRLYVYNWHISIFDGREVFFLQCIIIVEIIVVNSRNSYPRHRLIPSPRFKDGSILNFSLGIWTFIFTGTEQYMVCAKCQWHYSSTKGSFAYND